MPIQKIEQERAKSALEWAGKGVSKEALSAANGLPAMILINGLGQAAVFYKGRGGDFKNLYSLLSNWLCQKGKPYEGKDNLLVGITSEDSKKYRAAQVEALAYLQWVKKFAKAYAIES